MSPAWLPLEANPTVLQKYFRELGGFEGIRFQDVFSTEEWALDMVEGSTAAVVLLYPITKRSEQRRRSLVTTKSDAVWFSKQTVGNACGTMALLHAAMNMSCACDGWLSRFKSDTETLDPVQRAKSIEADTRLEALHKSVEHEGQTAQVDEEVNEHFVTFVCRDGRLFELDGRNDGPVCHGVVREENLLKAAVDVVKREFIEQDPTQVRFAIIALVV
ncbi:MAG: hypothetical protein KVP17_004399 [Porospora cf. gigantea B]|uniref:uncharacterized protein n=1 Tax=Porospora cf. gigantea B TaxID=2853592 RepID=UPI0035719DDB|nr:MAG: hypothetical protein KVP17_004399 [Porospora cf. gigantea B]